MERKRQAGFSLVELAIVLVVAGIVLAISAPAMHRYFESNKVRDTARQIASEMRIGRQKAVTNGTRNWYYAGTSSNANKYMTGVQTQAATGVWGGVTWTALQPLATNTRQISPNFGGYNYFYFGPDGKCYNPANALSSGALKVTSITSPQDTSAVNVDLTGEVWQ